MKVQNKNTLCDMEDCSNCCYMGFFKSLLGTHAQVTFSHNQAPFTVTNGARKFLNKNERNKNPYQIKIIHDPR